MPPTRIDDETKKRLKLHWQELYHKVVFEVAAWFAERDLDLQWDIEVYPMYPWGWQAVTACYDRLWILQGGKHDRIIIADIQHLQGISKFGNLYFSEIGAFDG